MTGTGKGQPGIEPRTARFVLITLMSKTHELAGNGYSRDDLIRHIQSEHCVDKKTAESLASVYLKLFSEANRKEWSEAQEAGFREFCDKEWTVEWEGKCDWHTKRGGSYPCRANASLTFAVEDEEKLHKHLSSELTSNPFLSADNIFDILKQQIRDDLDDAMEEYCDADDYYEPYFDEFIGDGTYDAETEWESWGLKTAEFTGSGYVDF